MPARLIISDANILIDMEACGLLEEMFALEYEFAVPDILFAEELKETASYLSNMGLLIRELGEEGVRISERLINRYRERKVSRNDLFVLALAMENECMLLTGDGDLKSISEEENIDVHGTIWLMEQLFTTGTINIARVESAYASMKTQGSRLPWGDVDKQMKRFRKIN